MFNHTTNDCWNLPSNAHKRPAYLATRSEEVNVLDDESATEELLEDNEEGQIGSAD